MKEKLQKAPVIAVARHRIRTDGEGVTSLVCFYGCPLRCRYCLNPFTTAPGTKFTPMDAAQLYEQLRVDELYFLSTGGGVTFGGGEPLLYAGFLRQFRGVCGGEWRLTAETSLAVPWEQVEAALDCLDEWIIDIKDTDPRIYRRYTGKENGLVLENLQRLAERIPPERVLLRLPLIPGYNTEADRRRSQERLEQMGFTRFDLFTYLKNDLAETETM